MKQLSLAIFLVAFFPHTSRCMPATQTSSLDSQLRRAVSAGDIELCKKLLQQGATISARGRNGFTALHVACQGSSEPMVTFLIKQGAPIHATDDDGNAPLNLAVSLARRGHVKSLLENNADPNLQQAKTLQTPLHIACKNGHQIIVQLLLDYGALISTRDIAGNSPLHLACSEGKAPVAMVLLEHGAAKNAFNSVGRAPLHLAVMAHSLPCIKMLVRYKVDLDAQTRENKKTALHIANIQPFTQVDQLVQFLVKSGASLNAKDTRGETPLSHAVQINNLKMCSLLLSLGAEKEVQNAAGIKLMDEVNKHPRIKEVFTSPLEIAARNGSRDRAEEERRYRTTSQPSGSTQTEKGTARQQLVAQLQRSIPTRVANSGHDSAQTATNYAPIPTRPKQNEGPNRLPEYSRLPNSPALEYGTLPDDQKQDEGTDL